jgi:3-phenylpropionate/trans-cinnamate dioxygenase ferredoxin subunit
LVNDIILFSLENEHLIYKWHKVEQVTVSTLAESTLTEVEVAGKRIGLLKRGNIIYAFTAACPHAGASLCKGWVNARGHIVCPDHKYHFDPANGRNTSGEGYKLFTYPVEIRGDEIFIGTP